MPFYGHFHYGFRPCYHRPFRPWGFGLGAGLATAAIIGAAAASAPPPAPQVVVVKQPAQTAQAPPPQPAPGPNLDYLTSSLASLESLMQAGNRAALQGQMPPFKTYYLQERQKFTDMALLQSMDSRMYALEQYLLTPAARPQNIPASVAAPQNPPQSAPLPLSQPSSQISAPSPAQASSDYGYSCPVIFESPGKAYPGAEPYQPPQAYQDPSVAKPLPVSSPAPLPLPPYPTDECVAPTNTPAPSYGAYPGAYPGLN